MKLATLQNCSYFSDVFLQLLWRRGNRRVNLVSSSFYQHSYGERNDSHKWRFKTNATNLQNSDCVAEILKMHLLTWVIFVWGEINQTWNSKTARFSRFLHGGRANGIFYWVQLSLAFGMLAFLALGTKYTPSHHDTQHPNHPQVTALPRLRITRRCHQTLQDQLYEEREKTKE